MVNMMFPAKVLINIAKSDKQDEQNLGALKLGLNVV